MTTLIKKPVFLKNIEFLRSINPSLAQRMRKWTGSLEPSVILSKTGRKIPVLGQVSLHSRYDPEKEARQWFKGKESKSDSIILFGLGFGYHLDVAFNQTDVDINVVEPSLDLFCLYANETDLSRFGGRVKFLVGETPAKVVSLLGSKTQSLLHHSPSVRLHESYFQDVEKGIELLHLAGEHPLRILVVPPIYGGSLPTAKYCFEAFQSLGHKPYWVDCDRVAEAFHSINKFSANGAHREIISKKFLEFISEAVIARAAEVRPDLIFVMAQAPLDPETVKRLKGLGVPIAFWFPEDFRTLTYWEDMAPTYDYFFTFQRGEFPRKLIEKGNVNFYYLPQACHPPVHKKLNPEEINPDFKTEISFMGAPYYNRVQSFVRLLDLPFKIWGEGWDKESAYREALKQGGKRVSTEETVEIFNASNININLHSSTFHEGVNPNGDFVNPRTFEIAACGGFQLVDVRQELSFLFDVEKEMAVFSDISDLRESIQYYQARPEERALFAEASQRRVLKEHTFCHRMDEMLVHIFIDNMDQLKSNLKSREKEWNDLVVQSAIGTSLEEYIKPFKDCENFSIKTLKESIEKGEGELSDTELLILMVNQVVQ